jgi:maleate isomerase
LSKPDFAEPRYSKCQRIGLIVPSLNVTIEPEFNAVVPRNISVHATRLHLARGDAKSLAKMALKTEDACALLDSANVDAIAYACTTGSLIKGLEWESRLVRRMRSKTKAQVITTAGSVVDALQELKLSRVALGTPYTNELNRIEVKFLESNGIKVTKVLGLGCIEGEDLHKLGPDKTVDLALAVDGEDAQGVFLSCTDLKTITVVENLEKRLRKPVISSNTATLWKMLKVLNYESGISGCGRLLRHRLTRA